MGEGKGPAPLLSFLKKRTKKLLCCCKDNHIVLYMLLLLPAVGIIYVFLPLLKKRNFVKFVDCSAYFTLVHKLRGNLRTYDV